MSDSAKVRSRFLYEIERDGIVAFLHLLKPTPIYVSTKRWRNPDAELQEILQRHELIADHITDDVKLHEARKRARQELQRPTILYLMMAQGCNLACSYCPIPGLASQYGHNLLAYDDAVAGISLWQKHIAAVRPDHKPYHLIFYGGEPLLNRPVVEQLLTYISNQRTQSALPQQLQLMLCTNGVLVDASFATLCAAHGVTVAIGLDGEANDNDATRRTTDGVTTTSQVLSAIDLLVRHGVRVVVSATITPQNVERISTCHQYFANLGVAQFGFNLMKGEPLQKALGEQSLAWYCRMAARGVLSGLTWKTSDGEPFEYQLAKRLALLSGDVAFVADCPCYGSQIVVQADGQITNCPFDRHNVGHVSTLPDHFRISETGIVQKLQQRIPLLNPFHQPGPALLTGGGCSWSVSKSSGLVNPDVASLLFSKEIIDELIWAVVPQTVKESLKNGDTTHWTFRRLGSL